MNEFSALSFRSTNRLTQFLKSTTISGFDNDNTSWSSHKNIREHPPVDGGAAVRQFSDSWAAALSGRTCDARYYPPTRYERNLRRGTVFWNCVCSRFENYLTVTGVWPVFLRNSVTLPLGWNWFYCNILILLLCACGRISEPLDCDLDLVSTFCYFLFYGLRGKLRAHFLVTLSDPLNKQTNIITT